MSIIVSIIKTIVKITYQKYQEHEEGNNSIIGNQKWTSEKHKNLHYDTWETDCYMGQTTSTSWSNMTYTLILRPKNQNGGKRNAY